MFVELKMAINFHGNIIFFLDKKLTFIILIISFETLAIMVVCGLY